MADPYASPVPAASDEKEEPTEKTPRRGASVKKALKKAFTPRKHSASAEDLTLDSPGGEGGEKKKGGWMKKLSSKVMSPRRTESAGAVTPPEVLEDAPEKEKEREVPAPVADAIAAAGDVAGGKPAEVAKAAVEGVGKAKDEAKEQVAQAAEVAADFVKVDAPETDVAAAAAAQIDAASAALSREVEAAHAKIAEPAYEVAATRDVALPSVVFEEKKPQKDEPKGSKKAGGQKGRGPLISLIGVAIGVAVIAMRLAK